MRRVFTIGETVLDIIFQNQIPVAAKAGGSMLNVAVTLGRLGINVHFVSEFGKDQVGDIVADFLHSNNVNTDFACRFYNGKTALSLAFLDECQNANYTFYKEYPSKRLDISIPDFLEDDIVLFGSFYSISSEIRETLYLILKKAKKSKAILIYDPNFRKSHLHELKELMPTIKENIEFADIIKGSNEDFELIFNTENPIQTFQKLDDDSKILLYTAGEEGAFYYSNRESGRVNAKSIIPVSTIGAGDNFNAGIVFGLLSEHVTYSDVQHLDHLKWLKILQHGINFASEVCLGLDNYISASYAKEYLKINIFEP